jgi:hypothetical protein
MLSGLLHIPAWPSCFHFMVSSRRDSEGAMLKRGTIVSASLLVVGALTLWLLGTAGILSRKVLPKAAQALGYGCLAIFGVFGLSIRPESLGLENFTQSRLTAYGNGR